METSSLMKILLPLESKHKSSISTTKITTTTATINISYNNRHYPQQKLQTSTYKVATTKENLQQYKSKNLNKEDIPNASAPTPSKLTMATTKRFNVDQTRNLTLGTL